jgi:hypothetical protein
MYFKTTKKLIGLAFTLVITSKLFGQLNNCINTKEHPLIEEIIVSVKTNRNHNSILAYTVIKGDQLGLARSTVINLAYAWATCKKITDSNQRKDEEFNWLDAILDEKEFDRLITYMEKEKYEKSKYRGIQALLALYILHDCPSRIDFNPTVIEVKDNCVFSE